MVFRPFFFASVRTSLYGGKLTQAQVDGLEVLLAYPCPDIRFLAYILATSYHETDRRMQPVYEKGPKSYFNKYEPGTKLGKALGNTQKGDGWLFRGRGHVQLTGRANYTKASHLVGVNLVEDPDAALVGPHACAILFEGMVGGIFTGKALEDYLNPTRTDFVNARRVVNKLDQAKPIAGYAKHFQTALTHSATTTEKREALASLATQQGEMPPDTGESA